MGRKVIVVRVLQRNIANSVSPCRETERNRDTEGNREKSKPHRAYWLIGDLGKSGYFTLHLKEVS